MKDSLFFLQLCFVVSFVLRVPGLEEGVVSNGKAWGWTTGTLIWIQLSVAGRRGMFARTRAGKPKNQGIARELVAWTGAN